MKKLLALVLALVMVMGLAAVGTNATYLEEKYTDVEDINYDEAVAVMSAVGVLEGADQKFRPGTELKRSEAAKIVAYLNTNNKTAEGLIGVGKFSDVPTNHWAAGYIDYLTSINVLAGRGDVFDPDGDLTAVDFAKMLLVVLGFDPQIEGLVGNDYKINTTKLAQDEKLFKGLGSDLNVNDVLTREQAAQMAFNAVKAPTVEYSSKGGSISINGAEIAIGASGYNYVTTTIANSQNIYKNTLTSANVNANSGYIVEFGERQYPALKLDDEATDAFGRPCSEWVYNKEEVGKFVNKDLLLETYTTAVTGADLFELLGESRINKSKLTYKVNGYPVVYLDPNLDSYPDATGQSHKAVAPNSAYDVYIASSGEADQAYRSYGMHASNMIRSNKIPYAFTGNGVLTEVYEKGEDLIIVSIYTYYAKADADYSVRSDKLALSFYAFHNGKGLTSDDSSVMDGQFPAPTFKDPWPSNVSAEDVPAAAKYKEKDKMLVRVAYTDAKKFEVQEIYDPEVVKGASISKFSTTVIGQKNSSVQYGGNTVKLVEDGLFYEGYIVTGGETQNYSKAVYPQGLFTYAKDAIDPTFDVVYDLYDYVIATVPNTSSNKYVFIAGVDNFTSNLGVRQADAFAIFANGDSDKIKVNVFDTNEEIDKYMKLRAKDGNGGGSAGFKYEDAVVSPDYTPSYPELDVNEPLHAYNRWFSYSVSGEGASAVYTLYPAGNSLMTGWRSCENDTTAKNAGDHIDGTTNVPVINLNSPRVVGDYTNYATDISVTAGNKLLAKRSAWGNQDSVYITVQTGKVSAKQYTNGEKYEAYQTRKDTDALYKRGIAKVTGIYTGIQNVSLKAYKGTTLTSATTEEEARKINPFHECFYTVYDPTSRFIIASVVVGSDSGNSDHYVYAVSDAGNQWKEGSYDFWEFNAIVDGEEKVLTVKEEYGTVIKDKIKAAMQFDMNGAEGAKNRTGMFEVTLDKDGYVVGAEQIWYTAGKETSAHKDEDDKIFANYEIGNKIVRINNGQKLYETYFGEKDLYRADKYTFYNSFETRAQTDAYYKAQDIGVTIAAGAPVYVIQQMKLEASGQIVTDIQKFSDFNTALGAVAKSNGDAGGTPVAKEYSGFVSAVLSNGRAEWVVLKNVGTILNYNNSKGVNPGTPAGSSDKGVELSAYTTGKGFKVTLSNFNDGESHTIRLTYIANTGAGTQTGLGVATVKTTSKSYTIMFTDNEATTDTDATSLGVDQVVPSATLKTAAGTPAHVVTLWVDGEEAAYATFKPAS